MHKSVSIETNGKRVPEAIRFYNNAKYTAKMACEDFFNILDLSEMNSWVSYREKTGERNSSSDSPVQMRKRCSIGFCKENKTTKICFKCNKYMCVENVPSGTQ